MNLRSSLPLCAAALLCVTGLALESPPAPLRPRPRPQAHPLWRRNWRRWPPTCPAQSPRSCAPRRSPASTSSSAAPNWSTSPPTAATALPATCTGWKTVPISVTCGVASCAWRCINAVPESSMVVFAPAAPKYTVTVFTDVDCQYCRALHKQIAEYNRLGVKVRYMFYPRTGPNTASWSKAEQVWCSHRSARGADRGQARRAAQGGRVQAQPGGG